MIVSVYFNEILVVFKSSFQGKLIKIMLGGNNHGIRVILNRVFRTDNNPLFEYVYQKYGRYRSMLLHYS